MRASTVLGLAALFKATIALPATNAEDSNDEPAPTITEAPVLAKRADATALWVSVDDEGRPATTLTPSVTTGDDGSTGMADAAPHDLTASVFTSTYYGIVATSTGDPPNPTATNKHTEGAFSRCYNEDGDNKPLCYPKPSSTLYKDTIYYSKPFLGPFRPKHPANMIFKSPGTRTTSTRPTTAMPPSK